MKARAGFPVLAFARLGRYSLFIQFESKSVPDFRATLAQEKLHEPHDIRVATETLRRWMIEDGIWLMRRPTAASKNRRCMLVLGWNHRVPALIAECAGYENEVYEIDIASLVPPDDREAVLSHHEPEADGVELAQIHADYTAPKDLKRL